MENFFFGAIAGLLSDAVVHPIDTLRTRLQVLNNAADKRLSTSGLLAQSVRLHGISNLYKGFGAVAIGTIPGHALYFAGYEASKSYLASGLQDKRTPGLTQLVHLTAGFLADFCGALVWTPMEVIKQRVQVDPATSSLKEFRRILAHDGIFGMYKGFPLALLTYGPYVSIYFALYEEYKHIWSRLYFKDEKLPFAVSFVGAGLSGSISAVVTCPLDVVKTNYQVMTRENSGMTYLSTARQLLRQNGYAVFFRGLKPRVYWLGGGTALTLSFYEFIKT